MIVILGVLSASVFADPFTDGLLTPEIQAEMEKNRFFYPTLGQLNDSLRSLAQRHPAQCRLDSIGRSYENRTIYCLEISDLPGQDEGEPELLFVGLHHANEWSSCAVPLFYCDSLLRAYGADTLVTRLVDERRFWFIPCFNVDGYYYSRDLNHTGWRKNRRPWGGSIGIDLNRNYPGAGSGNANDTWGGLPAPNMASHDPANDFFCGPYALSESENRALYDFLTTRTFRTVVSYHNYGEYVLWPWAWAITPAPDGPTIQAIGNELANMIVKQSGSGHYTGMQQGTWYQLCSELKDFSYGYARYTRGEPCYPIGIELGLSLAPDTNLLAQISRQNIKALFYLARAIDTVVANTPRIVVAPRIAALQNGNQYDVCWSPKTAGLADGWRLWEMMKQSAVLDTFGASNPRWVMSGFTPSSQGAHSGAYCLTSSYADAAITWSRIEYPYLVSASDTASFWVKYSLELNRDVLLFEISRDGLMWRQSSRLTGTDTAWKRVQVPLAEYADQSVYFRFRLCTDGDGISTVFVDDFYPAVAYDSIVAYYSLPDTFHHFDKNVSGAYYYRVVGYNGEGTGIFSPLIRVDVNLAVAEERTDKIRPRLPTVVRKFKPAKGMRLFNILGQEVPDAEKAGVYFLRAAQGTTKIIVVE
jgi:hypothetical protein